MYRIISLFNYHSNTIMIPPMLIAVVIVIIFITFIDAASFDPLKHGYAMFFIGKDANWKT